MGFASHSKEVPAALMWPLDFTSEKRVLGMAHHADIMGFKRLQLFTAIAQTSLNSSSTDGAYISVLFDSENNRSERELRREWVGLLRLYNLFHFIPDCFFLTMAEVANNGFQIIPSGGDSRGESAISSIDSKEWQSAFDYANPLVHPLLFRAQEYGWDPPEVGADIVGSDDSVIATCELVWASRKLAVILEELGARHRRAVSFWSRVELPDSR